MGYNAWWVLCIGLVIVYFVVNKARSSASRKNDSMLLALGSVKDFTPYQHFITDECNTGLAFDEKRKKVLVIQGKTIRVFDHTDLVSSEIFEDGSAVTRTVRSSQIGGAIIGGAMFGGVGAIIGGLSGTTTTETKIHRIDLRLTVNNVAAPIIDINFMRGEALKHQDFYLNAIGKARHWHGLMEVLIRCADQSADKAQLSVSDELNKLLALRDSGELSEQEFALQKTRLLGLG